MIALINNEPDYSGIGKYSCNLYGKLKTVIDCKYYYLNINTKKVTVFNGYNKKQIAINKPFSGFQTLFWHYCRECIKEEKTKHIMNQNLSLLQTNTSTIVTCMDLIPIIQPRNYYDYLVRRLWYSGLRKAKHIIAISENTKKELINTLNICASNITVIPLGVNINSDSVIGTIDLPVDAVVILNIASNQERKNFKAVINIFWEITKTIKNSYLVKIGTITHNDKIIIDKYNLNNRVIILPNVAESEINYWYKRASLFLFPSKYEGFGLPIIEAMANGCPVIASNTTAIPEVTGAAAILIKPEDENNFVSASLEILNNKQMREDLIYKGLERAKLFSWDLCAQRTIAVYKKTGLL